jgi:hypothetical protein
MKLDTAVRRCCVVEHRGRRYLVSAPTLGAVLLTMGHFAEHVTAFAVSANASPDLLAGGPNGFPALIDTLLPNVADGRIGEVLEQFCKRIGGERGDVITDTAVDRELAVSLVAASLSLCDVKACFEGAMLSKVKDAIASARSNGDDWVDPREYAAPLGLKQMAATHGCALHDVMDWPFEEVLMCNELRGIENDPQALDMIRTLSSARDASVN